ncbi:MAG: MBL fold metallo-hydrolase [Candidatus Thorarchaeota archaeon]
MNSKIILGICLAIVFVSAPYVSHDVVATELTGNQIKVNLLFNAGVMIETHDMRIYIDPYTITSNYSSLDADAVLITHPHGDHYSEGWVNALQKEGTVNIFPANMSAEIAVHNGTGVVPGDTIQVGYINITAFYMYTWAPEGYEPSHPPEANWTSYIIDINGFTIFHAGDSKDIPEYNQLSGQIDVAMLPLGPGCQTMTEEEVVHAIQMIDPCYFIPIHYAAGAPEAFFAEYADDINETTSCEIVYLEELSSHIFQVGPDTTTTTTTTSTVSSTSSTATTTTSPTTTTEPTTTPTPPDLLTPLYIGGAIGAIAVVAILVIVVRRR